MQDQQQIALSATTRLECDPPVEGDHFCSSGAGNCSSFLGILAFFVVKQLGGTIFAFQASGTIYVLRSKSDHPVVAA